jgi:hypothetical protein
LGGWILCSECGERADGKAVENYIERQGEPIEELRQLNLFDGYPAACRRLVRYSKSNDVRRYLVWLVYAQKTE